MRRNVRLRLIPVFLSFACLFGCGGEPGSHTGTGQDAGEPYQTQESGTSDTQESVVSQLQENAAAPAQTVGAAQGQAASNSGEKPEDFEPYQAPEFADAVFHSSEARRKDNVLLDLSCVNKGYGAVSVTSSSRVKIQITTDGPNDPKYQYDVPTNGTPLIFPLTAGSNHYTIFVGQNVEGTRYAQLYLTEIDVVLEDEFQPFIRPSVYVNYNKDSKCVQKAAELAQTAATALDVVEAVYEYVCDNITYDKELAAEVQAKTKTGYIPDLDQVMDSGKGICFDYAALAAAMLRSQGIPTKMVFGDVSPDDVYHAWNMFYTEQTGWVSVHFSVKSGEWNRLDLTFSANGADSKFIGDGGNYLDKSYY